MTSKKLRDEGLYRRDDLPRYNGEVYDCFRSKEKRYQPAGELGRAAKRQRWAVGRASDGPNPKVI